MIHSKFRLTPALLLGVVLSTVPVATRANEPRPGTAFSHGVVQALARQAATMPFDAPRKPEVDAKLTYDAYRDVRFKPVQSIWRGSGSPFELQLLPAGWLFEAPIALNLVEGGIATPVVGNRAMFDVGAQAAAMTDRRDWPLSGFRINGELNEPGKSDEIIVFQGASYFRGLSKGQVYGTSGRGLAIGTAGGKPEEFPVFKEFWIERAPAGARHIVVHALMDSPSVSGAYRFEIRPGSPTGVRVEATLFPRVDLAEIGIAPLTSMYLLSPTQPARVSDFRPRVHDADGLAIVNGKGERLWRPMRNPRTVQMSSFVDENPRGFGLIQRERSILGYLDFEARYERRPSTWVEPAGSWGRGSVILVELPTEEEINDNVVAFWRPERPLPAGMPHHFAYTLRMPDLSPTQSGPWIERTLIGRAHGDDGQKGLYRFAVDYRGLEANATKLPVAHVGAATGSISHVTVQNVAELGVVRVSFLFDPAGATEAELRVALAGQATPDAETWLYRWARD